jgi:hypothetical protein
MQRAEWVLGRGYHAREAFCNAVYIQVSCWLLALRAGWLADWLGGATVADLQACLSGLLATGSTAQAAVAACIARHCLIVLDWHPAAAQLEQVPAAAAG